MTNEIKINYIKLIEAAIYDQILFNYNKENFNNPFIFLNLINMINLKFKIVKFTDIRNDIIEIYFQLHFYNKKAIIIAYLL